MKVRDWLKISKVIERIQLNAKQLVYDDTFVKWMLNAGSDERWLILCAGWREVEQMRIKLMTEYGGEVIERVPVKVMISNGVVMKIMSVDNIERLVGQEADYVYVV